jgi:hypothetical protein
MRPILSATGTYNFKLAKWSDEKLKFLSINKYTVSDPLTFAEELREKQMLRVTFSYRITLHRFSPMYQLMKRSKYCWQSVEKEWFNWKCNLKLEKFEFVKLLKLAVKRQLFQIDGKSTSSQQTLVLCSIMIVM